MTAVMEDKDVYLTGFSRLEKSLKNDRLPWLNALRQSAIDRFAALGFPTLDDEEWRFTPLAALTRTPFEPADASDGMELAGGPLPAGAIFCPLAEALAKHPRLVEPHLGSHADSEEHAFTALNTAFLSQGAFLYLPKGCVVETPLTVRFHVRDAGRPQVWHRRILVIAEPASQATLIERYEGPAGAYFTNAVSEVVLGDGAVVDHVKVQQEGAQAFHVATMNIQLGKSSNFASHSITLGGQLTRNDIDACLGGAGGEVTLNGLYLGHGDQLIDNHTQIDHALPHCASHELYKGILDGKARGVFNGKIHVHPDAQKTDAKQTNKTLLLSDDATINTKPQLEIYADDVKCTHGATVGQLDAEALFYLRSRGIGADDARTLLTFAFANDIVSRIKVESLRTELEGVLRR